MKFFPELVLSAMRNGGPAGGVRLYCIAKHRDNGNGHLPIDEFKAYTKRYLGIPKARFNRWLRDALRLGIIKRSANVYSLASWGNAAVALGVTGLQTPVEMGVTKMANDGWAAWVWAAYLKRHENKPIARATLRKLTGIPERTQRMYEAEAGVENMANYANYGPPERNPDEAITEETNGWFWYYGQQKKRMPNSRTVREIERSKRGRTAKHNSFIRAALSKKWGSSQTEKQRIYFHGPNKKRAVNRTLAAMRKTERAHARWFEAFYLHSCDVMNVGLWEAMPC
jgi:hypothetical protein